MPSGRPDQTERPAPLESLIKAQAFGLGFDLVGITTLGPPDSWEHYVRWLDNGFEGDMEYMRRNRDLRADTRLPAPGATSAVVVGLNYGGGTPSGHISRYARGADYHRVLKERLQALARFIAATTGDGSQSRTYVDTGPVLERDLAKRAGLGWFGKNTNLIHPGVGSWFFIGALFLELDLLPDPPFADDHCGSCTRCIDACPTGALTEPRVLDAQRCISYLTIENRGAIPAALRTGIADLVYGCDICQEVCPWNISFAPEVTERAFDARGPAELPIGVQHEPGDVWHPGTANPTLGELLAMDEAAWHTFTRGSAMRRAGYSAFRRNVAVATGNSGAEVHVPALREALHRDDTLVRTHAAWALGEIGGADARSALMERLHDEDDAQVRSEILDALA